MPNRIFIISALIPAYVLLILHSVIPHHHHAPSHVGPLQYHHGYKVPHHDHDHHDGAKEDGKQEDHDHTAHFVHSPEFGNGMVKPVMKLIDFPGFQPYSPVIITNTDFWKPTQHIQPLLRPPKELLFYLDPTLSSSGLRGPPSLVMFV